MLNELIAKIKQDVSNAEKNPEKQMIIDHFDRTVGYLKLAQSNSNAFSGINL